LHKKEFLLKFAKDRKNWIHWLYEAKKRYGLCVLNYTVTSNHIHLLVKDTEENTIAKAMQLIASQTAQAYNKRKNRKGAFWEDRYHATAIDSEQYLIQCLVYIEMNMLRAGVIQHPGNWLHGGYREIQSPPIRYSIIDLQMLMRLTGMSTLAQLQRAHRDWINTTLLSKPGLREACWSESIAVGRQKFIESVQAKLGCRAQGRQYFKDEDKFYLKEPDVSYCVDFDA
jgi:putative transposase